MAASIRASNIATSIVIPRTLRADVQQIQEQSGASLGEITRVALAAFVTQYKERMAETELESA